MGRGDDWPAVKAGKRPRLSASEAAGSFPTVSPRTSRCSPGVPLLGEQGARAQSSGLPHFLRS